MRALPQGLLLFFLLIPVGSSPAQGPGTPTQSNPALQAEIAFWESIKDSKDPAEFKAYLERYPNGAFSELATLRLNRGSAGPGPLPKVGDTWTYNYVDLWKPGDRSNVTHTVASASATGILDTREGPNGRDEFLYSSQPAMAQRSGAKYEFSPYYFAFSPFQVGQSFRLQFVAADHLARWYLSGKAIRMEKISVPAGTFDAMKVELTGSRNVTEFRAPQPIRMTMVVWYSKEVKGVVKYSVQASSALGQTDKELYELVSFKLN